MHFVPGLARYHQIMSAASLSEMRKMLWMVHHVAHGSQGRKPCNW